LRRTRLELILRSVLMPKGAAT